MLAPAGGGRWRATCGSNAVSVSVYESPRTHCSTLSCTHTTWSACSARTLSCVPLQAWAAAAGLTLASTSRCDVAARSRLGLCGPRQNQASSATAAYSRPCAYVVLIWATLSRTDTTLNDMSPWPTATMPCVV